jgi:hypothetical protein
VDGGAGVVLLSNGQPGVGAIRTTAGHDGGNLT